MAIKAKVSCMTYSVGQREEDRALQMMIVASLHSHQRWACPCRDVVSTRQIGMKGLAHAVAAYVDRVWSSSVTEDSRMQLEARMSFHSIYERQNTTASLRRFANCSKAVLPKQSRDATRSIPLPAATPRYTRSRF